METIVTNFNWKNIEDELPRAELRDPKGPKNSILMIVGDPDADDEKEKYIIARWNYACGKFFAVDPGYCMGCRELPEHKFWKPLIEV